MFGLSVISTKWSHVENHDAFPKRFAGRNKPRVVFALGLVELVVFQRLEVKRGRKVVGMIGHSAALSLRWGANEASLEVRDFREALNLQSKGVSLSGGEIFAKPKQCAVNEHGNVGFQGSAVCQSYPAWTVVDAIRSRPPKLAAKRHYLPWRDDEHCLKPAKAEKS